MFTSIILSKKIIKMELFDFHKKMSEAKYARYKSSENSEFLLLNDSFKNICFNFSFIFELLTCFAVLVDSLESVYSM